MSECVVKAIATSVRPFVGVCNAVCVCVMGSAYAYALQPYFNTFCSRKKNVLFFSGVDFQKEMLYKNNSSV